MIGKVTLPGSLTAMPSAMVGPPADGRQAAQPPVHGRIEGGLDADDLDAGLDAPWPRWRCRRSARRRRSGPPAPRGRAPPPASPAPACPGPRSPQRHRTDGRTSAPRASASCQACRGRVVDARRPRAPPRAPKPRVFSTFTNGVRARHHDGGRHAQPPRMVGHALRVVAGRHRDHARRRLLRPSCASWFSAPRSLNEAVYCRFSNFSQTSAPVISDRVRELQARACRRSGPQPRLGCPHIGSIVTVTGTAAAGPAPAARRAPASGSCSGSPGRRRP